MTVASIVERVRVLMNEAGDENPLHLLSEDNIKLDVYIKSVIPDAINLVLSVAPICYINTSSASVVLGGGTYSIAELPADFLRLAAIKLNGWVRAVSVAYPFDSEIYKIQHNPITTAGANKPVCVFSYNSAKPVIECFPTGSLEFFHYVKSASNAEGGIGLIKDGLFSSVCYMCASLVYTIFENHTTAEKMKVIAIESIPKE